jgi:SRSO17 transposase
MCERVGRSLTGLLARVERRNSWQLAEPLGEGDPHGARRLLNGMAWDADTVLDDVVEHLGDAATGVLIVDETSFLKQGTRSYGVAPRYSGTAGATADERVGVFLAYASDRGTTFIYRALYLPRVGRRPWWSRAGRDAAGRALRHHDRAGSTPTRPAGGRAPCGAGWSSGGAPTW